MQPHKAKVKGRFTQTYESKLIERFHSTLAERGDVAGGFKDAVSAMRGTSPGMGREERILATIACHSAGKLGDKLSYEEMEVLIKDWLTSRYQATCPHARSICYRMEYKEIARKLDRR